MLYRVTHRTRYDYEESVGQCRNVAFMMPRNTLRQTCLQADVIVEPQPVALTERRDYFGNRALSLRDWAGAQPGGHGPQPGRRA